MEQQARDALRRIARAVRMAECMKELGIRAESAEKMNDETWDLAAALSCAKLGGEEFSPCADTRELTIGALRIAAGGLR